MSSREAPPTPAVGLWTTSLDTLNVAELRDTVRQVEAQGWSSLWFGEANGREAFSTAWLVLSSTTRLQAGTGIASIWGRDAVATAAAARTLQATYPGRFTLGLGVSHRPLVSGLRGHDYTRPLAAVSDYLTSLAASATTVPGEVELPPIIAAALGPKMIDLSARSAGGAITYLTTPNHTRHTRQRLGDGPRLVVEQAVVTGRASDRREWRRRCDAHLEIYLGLENYRRSLERQSLDMPPPGGSASDALREALVPHGAAEIADRVAAHLDAGADQVLLNVLGQHRGRVSISEWARLAREVDLE